MDSAKLHIYTRRVVALGLGAVLLWCAGAQGALFDDDEARRQIAVERKRVDDLSNETRAQQKAIDVRLARIEESMKSQGLLDLFNQIEALKLDMNRLRGQIEVLNNNVENSVKRQRDMYLDIDTRLRRLEQPAAPGPAAAAPAGTAGSAATPAPPPAPPAAGPPPTASVKPPVPPQASGPSAAPTLVPSDSGAETRVYEAAQSQRRIGNYQGAIVAFQNFIKQYPRSSLAPRAQYWIGDSYFNLRDFKLAISSQQALINGYPDSPTVPDAMLNIASSQIEMGESLAGRKMLEDLVNKFPISEAADKAKRRLAAFNAPTAGGKP